MKASRQQALSLRIRDINIKITTDDQRYYDYLRLYFNKVLLTSSLSDASIDICACWQRDLWGRCPPRPILPEGLQTFGANKHVGANRIVTVKKIDRKKKVLLDFWLKKDKLSLKAISHFKVIADTLRYDALGKPLEPYFFELTYVLVYYPLFWYLENFKNTYVMHASAVRVFDQCVVICGLEGIGKTSLSLSLAREKGARFFSDNLVFYGEDTISGCFEAIRIHKTDERKLWEGLFHKINSFKTLKDFYEPISYDADMRDRPNIFVIPAFGAEFSVEPVPHEVFANKVLNFNPLTAELGNYNEYASLLNLWNCRKDIVEARRRTLLRILEPAKCYQVTMRKADGLENNVLRFKEFIRRHGQ